MFHWLISCCLLCSLILYSVRGQSSGPHLFKAQCHMGLLLSLILSSLLFTTASSHAAVYSASSLQYACATSSMNFIRIAPLNHVYDLYDLRHCNNAPLISLSAFSFTLFSSQSCCLSAFWCDHMPSMILMEECLLCGGGRESPWTFIPSRFLP